MRWTEKYYVTCRLKKAIQRLKTKNKFMTEIRDKYNRAQEISQKLKQKQVFIRFLYYLTFVQANKRIRRDIINPNLQRLSVKYFKKHANVLMIVLIE